MSLWSFRFLLWYLCVLLVQPQNRFTFLWPLRIANLAFLIALVLHVFSCMERRHMLIRLGPGTILAVALLFFATLSQHFGVYQITSANNPSYDTLLKSCLLVIMLEATATTVERVWAAQMTLLVGSLWWIKGGLRLSFTGATFSGDRLWSVAVSIIDNPNSFAYYLCVLVPLYLYAYQQEQKKFLKLAFLATALSAVWIIFETGSRTGMVTLIAIGLFLVPHYGRKHLKSLVLVTLAVFVLYPYTGERNRERFRTIPQQFMSFVGLAEDKPVGAMSQDEQSADERKRKNIDTWGLIKENLMFGVGVYPDSSKFAERYPLAQGEVHCEILYAGKQMGLIGMGIYIGLLGTIFFGGYWIRQQARNWPAVRNLGWTFQLQAVAIAVGGSFNPTVWHPVMMFLVGSSSAMVLNLLHEKEAFVTRHGGAAST